MAGLFSTLSPEAARLATLLARHARDIPFQAGGAAWKFSACTPVTGARERTLAAYGSIGTSEWSLWLDEPGWRLAVATILHIRPEDAAAMPQPLVQAALECFFTEALSAIEKALGLAVVLTRIESAPPPAPAAAHAFRLAREDGLTMRGSWVASGNDWRDAVETALRRVPPRMTPIPETVLLEGIVSAEAWRLPEKILRGVETGDVVLSHREAAWTVTVGGRFCFAAHCEKGKVVVDGSNATGAADSFVDDALNKPETPVLADVGEAEVVMRAEVGRLGVTVAELRRLAVGEVVEFATSVDSPVTLVAGGQPIATGELVDVGGRVGVRITAMTEGQEKDA